MSSTRSKLNRPRRRRETTYRRGYEDGKIAAQRELGVRWVPIEQADRSITDVQDFSEVGVMLRLSERYWVRDGDGRIYEAVWTDDKNGYWWDLEGESTVDPTEFMPHPQDTRFVGSAALSAVKSMELLFHCDMCSATGYGDAPCSPICDRPAPSVAEKADELDGVPDALACGQGIWRTCSGCHESNEGYPTGPYSDTLKCHLGGGCFECGGIGAVWDMTDYEDMANFLALSAQVQDVVCQTCNGTGKEARHQICRDCDGGTADVWQLVPIEPSAGMIAAAKSTTSAALTRSHATEIYRAMLAAAPAKQERSQ